MLLSSPSACWCPPSVCVVVVLNGGVRCVLSPVFGLGSPLHVVLFFFCLVCCCVCCGWGSAGVCGVVCGLEWRWCLLPILVCVVVCISVWCVLSCGMAVGGVCGSCCLSCFVSSLFFLLLFLCAGVRGSARAALRARTLSPNTTVFPCCVLCLVLSSPLPRSPPFFNSLPFFCCRMAVGVYHVSVCCVGMTAIGSLSLSSSFFW